MKIVRVNAIQAHPVPDRVHAPRGPFPQELFREPEIVTEYVSESDETGNNFELGATAQNNFKPEKILRCRSCHEKVLYSQTSSHSCSGVDNG
jgi:hypothetical protein